MTFLTTVRGVRLPIPHAKATASVRYENRTAMPRDLHGLDPVLGYSKNKDIQGVTSVEPTDTRKASVMLADMAITSAGGDVAQVDREELLELIRMIGYTVETELSA